PDRRSRPPLGRRPSRPRRPRGRDRPELPALRRFGARRHRLHGHPRLGARDGRLLRPPGPGARARRGAGDRAAATAEDRRRGAGGRLVRRFAILALLLVGLELLIPLGTEGQGSQALLSFGFLILAAYTVGELASPLGLPKIVGYLLSGVLFGPH